MFTASGLKDYRLLDTGNGMKLENWAGHVLSRPDPQIIWAPEKPDLWKKAEAVYVRSASGGGRWQFNSELPESWNIELEGMKFLVRPTGFKHTGLFPEQSVNWRFISEKIKQRGSARVLNLFAYTGGATVSCLKAVASVFHVDAAKSMNSWAKENVSLNGLSDRPVRFIADDCLKFVLREQRRGNRYDGIIMDPPSYGRGSDGQIWKLEDDLFNLLTETVKLLSADPLFLVVSSYTTGLSDVVVSNLLNLTAVKSFGGSVESGPVVIPVENSSVLLPCGNTARWSK